MSDDAPQVDLKLPTIHVRADDGSVVDLGQLLGGLADAMVGLYCQLSDRIRALETQVAEVQERGIRYCGVWQRALTYRRGDVCTCNGAMWVALRPTEQMPGNSEDWQLSVKLGR